MIKILVSACLLGQRVRYDGEDKHFGDDRLTRWFVEGRLVSYCPEVGGGLPVPRPPAEIQGGSGQDVLAARAFVKTDGGDDVSTAFIAGANGALDLALQHQVRFAILKARSPSCGSLQIYDGSHGKILRDGQGVTAALLMANHIPVFDEEHLDEAEKLLLQLEETAGQT